MQFKGKALRLADLGEISEKAKASWDYFGFEDIAEPGSLCGKYGWEGWRAVLSGSEAVIVMDESLDLNMSTIFPDVDDFILWLEESYEEREE